MFVAQRGLDFALSCSHGVSFLKSKSSRSGKSKDHMELYVVPCKSIAMQKVEQYRRACVEMDLFFFMLVSLDSQICSRTENVVSRFQTIKICRQGEFMRIPYFEQNDNTAFACFRCPIRHGWQ